MYLLLDSRACDQCQINITWSHITSRDSVALFDTRSVVLLRGERKESPVFVYNGLVFWESVLSGSAKLFIQHSYSFKTRLWDSCIMYIMLSDPQYSPCRNNFFIPSQIEATLYFIRQLESILRLESYSSNSVCLEATSLAN